MAGGAESPSPADTDGLLRSVDQSASIALRVWRVANEFGVITKDATMNEKAGGYGYATIDGILARARTLFDKHGILIAPNLVESKQDGNRTVCQFDVAFISVDDPDDQLVVRVPAYANDNGDKGPPKAVTQAIKTAIKSVLNLTTKEDEDANTPEHKGGAATQADVDAAKEKARQALKVSVSAIKAAYESAKTLKDLRKIKRENDDLLASPDLPEVTGTFLDELFRRRHDELEQAETHAE